MAGDDTLARSAVMNVIIVMVGIELCFKATGIALAGEDVLNRLERLLLGFTVGGRCFKGLRVRGAIDADE